MKMDMPTRNNRPLEEGCTVVLDGLCDEGDLPGYVLEGIDFSREDVRGWDFRECVLRKCTLADADLRGCSFIDVIFDHCDLSGCQMENAVFQRVRFDTCRMTGADMPHMVMRNVSFDDCKADYLNLFSGKVNLARMAGCNLSESVWDSVQWQHMEWDGCDLTRATVHFTSLKGLDLRTCKLDGLLVDIPALRGAVVTPLQAAELAKLLGLVVK